MDVPREPVARADRRDLTVGVVDDDVVAVADAQLRLPAPPGENRPPVVTLGAKVGHSLGVEGVEPDELARIVEDHRAGLGDSPLRREEDVAGRGVACRRRDLHHGRPQVGTRAEVLRRRRGLRGLRRGLVVLVTARAEEPEREGSEEQRQARTGDARAYRARATGGRPESGTPSRGRALPEFALLRDRSGKQVARVEHVLDASR